MATEIFIAAIGENHNHHTLVQISNRLHRPIKRCPNTTQTKIEGKLTRPSTSATNNTAVRLCEGAYSVRADNAKAQAFGFTH